MSAKLPTLWVNVRYYRGTLAIPGASVSAYVDGETRIDGEVAYVPRAELDAALDAARAVAQRRCDGCWKDKESKKHGHHDFCEARTILTAFGLAAGRGQR